MIELSELDRQYVEAKLDRSQIEELARKAILVLTKGETVELTYQPGDMTWYSIIIAPLWNIVAAPGGGNTTGSAQSYVGGTGTYIVVYSQKNQAVWVSPGDDMEWACQKFDTTPASQLAIALLLKEIFP